MSGLVSKTPVVPPQPQGAGCVREGHNEGAPVSLVHSKSSIRTVMFASDIPFSFPQLSIG